MRKVVLVVQAADMITLLVLVLLLAIIFVQLLLSFNVVVNEVLLLFLVDCYYCSTTKGTMCVAKSNFIFSCCCCSFSFCAYPPPLVLNIVFWLSTWRHAALEAQRIPRRDHCHLLIDLVYYFCSLDSIGISASIQWNDFVVCQQNWEWVEFVRSSLW